MCMSLYFSPKWENWILLIPVTFSCFGTFNAICSEMHLSDNGSSEFPHPLGSFSQYYLFLFLNFPPPLDLPWLFCLRNVSFKKHSYAPALPPIPSGSHWLALKPAQSIIIAVFLPLPLPLNRLPAAVIRACNCVCLCNSVLVTGCWTSRLFPVLCPDKQSCTQSLHTWTSVHSPVRGSIPIPLCSGGFELGWVHTSSLQGVDVTGIPAATQVVAEWFSMLLPGIYLYN